MTVCLDQLLAIDVETSGPNPYEHSILAVAFVPFTATREACSRFIKHDSTTWTDVGRRYFQKYRKDWEEKAVAPDVAAHQIAQWLSSIPVPELMLVGHNVGFDFAFLRQLAPSFPKLSHRTIDTHTLLRVLSWQGRVPHQACTSEGALHYFGIEPSPNRRHTALADAEAARDLFLKLLEIYDAPKEAFDTSKNAISSARSR